MRLLGPVFWIYRFLISPALKTGFGIQCRFEESCSLYTERMMRERGVAQGTVLGFRRFISCNPFNNLGAKNG